jgi:hypothetical protein
VRTAPAGIDDEIGLDHLRLGRAVLLHVSSGNASHPSTRTAEQGERRAWAAGKERHGFADVTKFWYPSKPG